MPIVRVSSGCVCMDIHTRMPPLIAAIQDLARSRVTGARPLGAQRSTPPRMMAARGR